MLLTNLTTIIDHVHVIRYEDVSLNKSKVASELQEFLDLEKSSFLEKYVSNQKHKSPEFLPKTKRKEIADKDILEIQNVCSRPMKTLGYLPLTSKEWNNKDNYKRIEKLSVQFQTI